MLCGCAVRVSLLIHKNSTEIQKKSNMETTMNHYLIEDLNCLSSGCAPYSAHFSTMKNHRIHQEQFTSQATQLFVQIFDLNPDTFPAKFGICPSHSKTIRFGIISSGDLFRHDISNQLVQQQEQPCRIGNFGSKQHCSIQIKRVHHPWNGISPW